MYLKEKLIRFLKIKNVILVTAGAFWLFYMFFAITFALQDNRTEFFFEAMGASFLGVLAIVCSRVSRSLINDAFYFSRYFEGDLSGYVEFQELAELTGMKRSKLRRRLKLLRRLYMKKYEFVPADGEAGERIELYSKTVTCTCRSCGGAMEKRVYFTGECPYCGSSDLTAKVVSGEHFYCISEKESGKGNTEAYYRGRHLNLRMALAAIGWVIVTTLFMIFVMMSLDYLGHLNDKDYLTQMMLKGKGGSFAQVQTRMRDQLIFNGYAAATLFFGVYTLMARILCMKRAKLYAGMFSRVLQPFLSVTDLGRRLGQEPAKELHRLVKAIREGYLKGCSPEKHGGPLRIGLAKQIVKDRCPSCAAPITGAVDESYTCKYCGNQILGVIRKQ